MRIGRLYVDEYTELNGTVIGQSGATGPTGPQGATGLEGATGPTPTFRPTYTYYVAKNGNDTTGDGSAFNPYLTIQKAITIFEATTPTSRTQSIIYVAPGLYTESLTFTKGYVALISNYNALNVVQTCEISGNISVAITTGGDLANNQVIIQGFQITGSITDTSTQQHTLTIQDSYINAANRALYQNASADARTRLYNCVFATQAKTVSSLPQIDISRGSAFLERVDATYNSDGSGPVLLVEGNAGVTCILCNFASNTTSSDSSGSAVKVVNITTNGRSSVFNNCSFTFESTATTGTRGNGTGGSGFYCLYYNQSSSTSFNTTLAYCRFKSLSFSTSTPIASVVGMTSISKICYISNYFDSIITGTPTPNGIETNNKTSLFTVA